MSDPSNLSPRTSDLFRAASKTVVRRFPVRELLETRGATLRLEVLTPEADLERGVADPDISSPGLALAGYTKRGSTVKVRTLWIPITVSGNGD